MPKRTDIKRILVIGSGPIVIGQACEFDYSGAQACKVLKEDGFEVILVNSNPATIMTDPGLADRTYVEPITAEFIERVIKKERPDALLPTLGGQTGLNAAVELAKDGTLDKYGVEMIGCDLAAIERGEDRKLFNEAMAEIGLRSRARAMPTAWPTPRLSPSAWAIPAYCARALPRRRRRRHRSHPRGARLHREPEPRALARPRGAGRGVYRGLERV